MWQSGNPWTSSASGPSPRMSTLRVVPLTSMLRVSQVTVHFHSSNCACHTKRCGNGQSQIGFTAHITMLQSVLPGEPWEAFSEIVRIGSNIRSVMGEPPKTSRAGKKGKFRAFISWLTMDPALGIKTTAELLAFFKPGFEHWSRKREDLELINGCLEFVYPG